MSKPIQCVSVFNPANNATFNARKSTCVSKAKSLGFSYARFNIEVTTIAPISRTSGFTWTYFDEMVNYALAQGMGIALGLSYGGAYASGGAGNWQSTNDKAVHNTDITDLSALYLAALSRMFNTLGVAQEDVYVFAWNEPGNLNFGASTPGKFPDDTTTYSGTAYTNKNRSFWNTAYPAIRTAYPSLKMASPTFEYNNNTTVSSGATSATQALTTTAFIRAGDTLHFNTAGVSRVVQSISGNNVVLDSSLTTTTNEVVVHTWNWNITNGNVSLNGTDLDAHWAAYDALDFHLYPNFASSRYPHSPEEIERFVREAYERITSNINSLTISAAGKNALLAKAKTFSEIGFDYNNAGLNQTSNWSKWGNEKMRGRYIQACLDTLNRVGSTQVPLVSVYNCMNIASDDDNRSDTQHYGLCNYNGDINNAGKTVAQAMKATSGLTVNVNNPSTAT